MNPVMTVSYSYERWIKYYSSSHNILLVGEGDFSFSLSLGMAFGSATNIVATTLDSYDELISKYKNAEANLMSLRMRGATVLHGVDATQMWNLPHLRCKKFHRIIYNFPHAGFLGIESDPDVIMMHRGLVRGFLHNASTMLTVDGEIHINHKKKSPYDSWRIEDLGSECSLVCVAQDEFRICDYPWYNNKRGSGSRADEPFPLGACKTYRFRLHPSVVDNLMKRKLDLIQPAPQMFITHGVGVQQHAQMQMFSHPPPPPPPQTQMFSHPPPPPPPQTQMFSHPPPPPPPQMQMFSHPPPPPPPLPQMQMFSHPPPPPPQTQMFSHPPPPPPPPPPRGMQCQPLTMYDDGVALHNYATECRRIFGRYLENVEERFGDTSYDVGSSIKEAMHLGYEMYLSNAAPGKPLAGFTCVLEELHRLSIVRSERLRQMLLRHDLR